MPAVILPRKPVFFSQVSHLTQRLRTGGTVGIAALTLFADARDFHQAGHVLKKLLLVYVQPACKSLQKFPHIFFHKNALFYISTNIFKITLLAPHILFRARNMSQQAYSLQSNLHLSNRTFGHSRINLSCHSKWIQNSIQDFFI